MHSFPVRNGSKFPLVFSSKLLIPPAPSQITVRFLSSPSSRGWGVIVLSPHSCPGVETEEMLCVVNPPIRSTSVQIASTAFVFPLSFQSCNYLAF